MKRRGAAPMGLDAGSAAPIVAELVAVNVIIGLREMDPPATFREIAKMLRKQGYRTKRGGQWHASTVRAIWMRRDVYSESLKGSKNG